MTEKMQAWANRLVNLPSHAAALSGLFAIYFAFIAPLAWWFQGQMGLVSAGLATVVCLVACWLALIVTEHWIPQRPALCVPLGMLIRMSLPLLACLVVTQTAPQLTNSGFAWYLIGAFLVGLTLETVLAVGRLKALNGKQITHDLG